MSGAETEDVGDDDYIARLVEQRTGYKRFTDLIDIDHQLRAFILNGEIRPGLLSGMTRDIFARRLDDEVKSAGDNSKNLNVPAIANAMHRVLVTYWELDALGERKKISDLGHEIKATFEDSVMDYDEASYGTLADKIPSMLEASYMEAKKIITAYLAEYAQHGAGMGIT